MFARGDTRGCGAHAIAAAAAIAGNTRVANMYAAGTVRRDMDEVLREAQRAQLGPSVRARMHCGAGVLGAALCSHGACGNGAERRCAHTRYIRHCDFAWAPRVTGTAPKRAL